MLKLFIILLLMLLMGSPPVCRSVEIPQLLQDDLAKHSSVFVGSDVVLEGSYQERVPAENGELYVKTEIVFKSRFSTRNPALVRMDCSPYTMSITDRRGEFVKQDISFISDGTKWMTILRKATTKSGSWSDVGELTIDERRPSFLGDRKEEYVTGQAVLLERLGIFVGQPLSKIIESLKEGKVQSSLATEERGWRLTVWDECTASQILLKKGTNLVPLEWEQRFGLCSPGSLELKIRYEFSDLRTVKGPGGEMEVPHKLVRFFHHDGKITNEAVTIIDKIKFEPESTGETYQVSLPPGWIVNDRRHNVIFQTGMSPLEMVKSARSLGKGSPDK